MTLEEFKKQILSCSSQFPSNWRKGQKVFNYIDYKYGIARAIQFNKGVDCFYQDKYIDAFIEEAYNILKEHNQEINFSSYTHFEDITTFEQVLEQNYKNKEEIENVIYKLEEISPASAASFKINLIQSCINALTKNILIDKIHSTETIWYPYITMCSINDIKYIQNMADLNYINIGSFKYNNKEFLVFSGQAHTGSYYNIFSEEKICYRELYGFASYDRAIHFSKYFGMLLIQARYGDFADFKITNINV